MNSDRRNRAKRHACRRARERWDAALDLEEIGALNVIIRSGLGRPLGKRNKRNGRSFWVTTLGMDRIPIVYSYEHNTIVTVLPKYADEVVRSLKKLATRQ